MVSDYIAECGMITPFTLDKPGSDWFRSFCFRNNLKIKKYEPLQSNHNTLDLFIIYNFYDLLESIIDEIGVREKPSHIWNLDESGI